MDLVAIIVVIIVFLVLVAVVIWQLIYIWNDPGKSEFIKVQKIVRLTKQNPLLYKYNPSIVKVKDFDRLIGKRRVQLKEGYICLYRIETSHLFLPFESKIGISLLDMSFNVLREFSFKEIPYGSVFIRGYEDPRVFISNNKIYSLCGISTLLEGKATSPIHQQYLVHHDLQGKKLTHKILNDSFEPEKGDQKNWNFIGEVLTSKHNINTENCAGDSIQSNILLNTRIEPHTVISVNPETGEWNKKHSTSNKLLARLKKKGVRIHAGTKPVRIGDHYVAICHTKRWILSHTIYRNVLYEFNKDPPYNVTRISRPFSLPSLELRNDLVENIQMTTGFEEHDENTVLVTLGVDDVDMYGCLIDKKEILRILDQKWTLRDYLDS